MRRVDVACRELRYRPIYLFIVGVIRKICLFELVILVVYNWLVIGNFSELRQHRVQREKERDSRFFVGFK